MYSLHASKSKHAGGDQPGGAEQQPEHEVAVGQYQQVSVATDTCGLPELAVSNTKILLRSLKNVSTRHLIAYTPGT